MNYSKPFILLFAVVGTIMSIVLYRTFSIVCIVSDSMAPTLVSDASPWLSDWMLVEEASLVFQKPSIGSVVVFKTLEATTKQQVKAVKRLAGLPGNVIEIQPGKLLLNGNQCTDIPETILKKYENGGHFQPGRKLRVKDHSFFLLGDNSHYSFDSRYYGAVDGRDIEATAIMRVWPPWRIGRL